MGFRPWRTWERLQDISVSRAPSVTLGDQKPKALSETLEMPPQQMGKHREARRTASGKGVPSLHILARRAESQAQGSEGSRG